jgi:hypothetical protein
LSDAIHTDPLFGFIVYLVSCARISLDEPALYGSFRLIEGASKLVTSFEETGVPCTDDFLVSVRDEIEREKLRMVDDHDGYTAWVDGLLRRVAAEATRRNLEVEA